MVKVSKRKVVDYSVMLEEISPDNVLAMSEAIALRETKFLIGYMHTYMQKMNTALYVDLKNKSTVSHLISDSYDLVQECAVYLCEHFGEHLQDVIGYDKKGKAITVRIACVKKMMKLVNRKTSDNYRSVSLETLTPVSEPSIEMPEEDTQDYTVYDSIVENLNLTDNMRTALDCRMAGLSYPEIGRILERAQATVYEYFIKMRKRYADRKTAWKALSLFVSSFLFLHEKQRRSDGHVVKNLKNFFKGAKNLRV